MASCLDMTGFQCLGKFLLGREEESPWKWIEKWERQRERKKSSPAAPGTCHNYHDLFWSESLKSLICATHSAKLILSLLLNWIFNFFCHFGGWESNLGTQPSTSDFIQHRIYAGVSLLFLNGCRLLCLSLSSLPDPETKCKEICGLFGFFCFFLRKSGYVCLSFSFKVSKHYIFFRVVVQYLSGVPF